MKKKFLINIAKGIMGRGLQEEMKINKQNHILVISAALPFFNRLRSLKKADYKVLCYITCRQTK